MYCYAKLRRDKTIHKLSSSANSEIDLLKNDLCFVRRVAVYSGPMLTQPSSGFRVHKLF